MSISKPNSEVERSLLRYCYVTLLTRYEMKLSENDVLLKLEACSHRDTISFMYLTKILTHLLKKICKMYIIINSVMVSNGKYDLFIIKLSKGEDL